MIGAAGHAGRDRSAGDHPNTVRAFDFRRASPWVAVAHGTANAKRVMRTSAPAARSRSATSSSSWLPGGAWAAACAHPDVARDPGQARAKAIYAEDAGSAAREVARELAVLRLTASSSPMGRAATRATSCCVALHRERQADRVAGGAGSGGEKPGARRGRRPGPRPDAGRFPERPGPLCRGFVTLAARALRTRRRSWPGRLREPASPPRREPGR